MVLKQVVFWEIKNPDEKEVIGTNGNVYSQFSLIDDYSIVILTPILMFNNKEVRLDEYAIEASVKNLTFEEILNDESINDSFPSIVYASHDSA